MVKTLFNIPPAYSGQCELVINDKEFDIVARNAILLLTALHLDADTATPIMLHLWYSATIPAQMLQDLQKIILPLIQEVYDKIRSRSAGSLQAKRWTYGTRSLRLVLRKEDWGRLLSFFEVPDGLSVAEALALRTSITMAPERKDFVDRALYHMPKAQRVATMKFRQEGILLPFGSPLHEFNTPNP